MSTIRVKGGTTIPAVDREPRRAALDGPDAQPDERVAFIAADGNHHEPDVDAVAGSEFVDDQIRLGE